MRDMQTCREEVFRRSGERIRRRQRRRRTAAALGAPLALCVVIGVAAGPGWMRMGSAAKNDALPAPEEMENTAQVQVISPDADREWRAESSAADVLASILEWRAETMPAEMEKDANEAPHNANAVPDAQNDDVRPGDPETASQSEYGMEDPAYRIVLRNADGTEQTYALTLDGLVEEMTGEWIPLTEEQAAELRQALGID